MVDTIEPLTASAASGASSLAWWRTSVNETVVSSDTVAVTALSNEYGTSTPSVFRPSERTNCTWYCSTVIQLACDGAAGAEGEPGSLRPRPNWTRPRSLKIVGDDFTTVTTSELSVPPNSSGFAPDAPS